MADQGFTPYIYIQGAINARETGFSTPKDQSAENTLGAPYINKSDTL